MQKRMSVCFGTTLTDNSNFRYQSRTQLINQSVNQ